MQDPVEKKFLEIFLSGFCRGMGKKKCTPVEASVPLQPLRLTFASQLKCPLGLSLLQDCSHLRSKYAESSHAKHSASEVLCSLALGFIFQVVLFLPQLQPGTAH